MKQPQQAGRRAATKREKPAEPASQDSQTPTPKTSRRRRLDQELEALLDEQEKLLEENDALKAERAAREDDLKDMHDHFRAEGSLWWRHAITVVAVANAAAAVSTASAFVQAQDKVAAAHWVSDPLTSFTLGMLAAGAVPLFASFEAKNYEEATFNFRMNVIGGRVKEPLPPDGHLIAATYLATLSRVAFGAATILFCVGMMLTIGTIRGVAAGS